VHAGFGHIVLDNLTRGLVGARLLDVKIGARTCSKRELMAHGRGAPSSWLKKHKLKVADWATMSGDRGFRVVASSGHPGDGRRQIARRDPNQVYNAFFAGFPLPVGAAPVSLNLRQQAADAVENIRTSVNWCDYAMIAASVLIVVGWARLPAG